MKVRVCYDNGHDYGEFEYFSKYNRINAKGIKEEVKSAMRQRYGKRAYNYIVTDFYRVED